MSHHGADIRLVPEYNTSKYTACCQNQSSFAYQRQVPSVNSYYAGQKKQLAKDTMGPYRWQKRTLRGLLYCNNSHPHPPSTNPLLNHQQHQQQQPQLHHLSSSTGHHHAHGNQQVARVEGRRGVGGGRIIHSSHPWNRDVSAACCIGHIMHARTYGELHPCFVYARERKEVDAEEQEEEEEEGEELEWGV